MSEIDHDAAKQFAVDRENEAHMPRTSNLARAYLDVHRQLAAERARLRVWIECCRSGSSPVGVSIHK